MPSFDAVSELDTHELTNAVDQANRELSQRFDFKDTGASFELKEKEFTVSLKAPADVVRWPGKAEEVSRAAVAHCDGRGADHSKRSVRRERGGIPGEVWAGGRWRDRCESAAVAARVKQFESVRSGNGP